MASLCVASLLAARLALAAGASLAPVSLPAPFKNWT
jgi:hypothetical protein